MQHDQSSNGEVSECITRLREKLSQMNDMADTPSPCSLEVSEETENALRIAEDYARSILETARECLLVLDESLRVRSANPSFYATFRLTQAEAAGCLIHEIRGGEWNIPTLRALLEEIIPLNHMLHDYEVEHDFVDVGRKTMLLNARRVEHADTHQYRILLAIEDITERKQVLEDNRRLREELEERVKRRTAELEAANRELESFSYTVSHDLRSPLRGIDGFSRILLDDYAAQLPEPVQNYLHDIRRNAIRMGQLIDDMLTFSRLSRQGLQTRTVSPIHAVNQALDELRMEREGRNVEMVIGELLPCQADPALLKQIWINLLANALKYSRRRDIARIEVGSRIQGEECVYWVRDNGVGFDMQYAGKLFGVFQRMHKASEYEGTGVGLAIVQRIVHRHGGRIWAEAIPDHGATFSFALPSTAVVEAKEGKETDHGD